MKQRPTVAIFHQHLGHKLIASITLCLLLTGCFSPKPPAGPTRDRELDRLTRLARATFERGRPGQAANIYQDALTRARALDQAGEIGNAAYNLAVCLTATGKYEAARERLLEAETELIHAKMNVADVFLVQSKVARWQKHPEEALVLVEKVLSHPSFNSDGGASRPGVLVKGGIACDQGDAVAARAALATAEKETGTLQLAGQAELARLAGRTSLCENNPEAAARQFDREAALWQETGRYQEMARALARAGQAWSNAKQITAGAQRYFRAARSSFAQGNHTESRQWIRSALALAESGTDEPLKTRVRTLQAQIETASGSGETPP